MTIRDLFLLPLAASLLVGCADRSVEEPAETPPAPEAEAPTGTDGAAAEPFEIAPGLTARILRPGSGDTAEAGDSVEVDYTGWLYDAEAPDNRGTKFDSSIDRGQKFTFPLGAGRVIRGWDQGVAGMQVGEVRELTIAPEMAYGDRAVGNVIPPGSTLVFEVELFSAESLAAPAGD
ncbi:MAG: FKBP-type peptidyl-prolyl cis-trans isomerase [Woeseiaceae bacterium]|nr:FKBP-type peptidyl-prolyl cis-trans isomerase [Woeseiaceae bacterium]